MNQPEPVLRFIQQRIDALLKYPDLWGAPESVELQLLLLWELRRVTWGSGLEEVNALQAGYVRFLDGQLTPGPDSLAARLGLTDQADGQFIAVLRAFERQELISLASRIPFTRLPFHLQDQSGDIHYGAGT